MSSYNKIVMMYSVFMIDGTMIYTWYFTILKRSGEHSQVPHAHIFHHENDT